MLFIILKLFLFFGVLFIFGWQAARFLLREKRIEALIPLSAVSGISIYLLLLNASSYFINIKINFYLILAVFAVLSYFLYRFNRKKEKIWWTISSKWRRILLGTCFLIMVFAGIDGIRALSSDQMFFNHLPEAATIANGNFPVKATFAPNFPSQYHYASNLFLAAITKFTGLPIWFSQDLHVSIFIGIAFLLGFLIINDFFVKSDFRAYLASLVMILGGNFGFLYAVNGFFSLYKKYILNQEVLAPFKFMNDIIFGQGMQGGLLIYHFQAGWRVSGLALVLAIVYLYFKALGSQNHWLKISVLAGILFAFLALVAEIFFGVLAIVLLMYSAAFTVLKKDWQKGKLRLKASLLILLLGISIASLQGGIFTQAIRQIFFGLSLPLDHSLSITLEYILRGLMFTEENVFVPFFSLTFLLGWGWFIVFMIPVAAYALIRHFQSGLFFILLILISFFLPLVLTAGPSQGEFMRINFMSVLFWNLTFGLFLGWLLLLLKSKWQKPFVVILIFCVIFQGIFYLAIFTAFPALQLGRPLIAEQVPKPNPAELEAFSWIKKNTAIEDYFLTFDKKPSAFHQNSRFVIHTGRFAPNFLYGAEAQTRLNQYRNLEALKPSKVQYQKILEECSPDALKALKYRYLYVNELWPQGLEEKCLANNNLELKFEANKGDNFAKIYEL